MGVTIADEQDGFAVHILNGDGKDRVKGCGDFGEFLMSMMQDGGSSNNHGKKSEVQTLDPNFRYAAPFLAAVTSYMERNSIPFEHVDLWVPSTVPPSLDKELGSAPQMAQMGSGANLAAMAPGSNENEKWWN